MRLQIQPLFSGGRCVCECGGGGGFKKTGWQVCGVCSGSLLLGVRDGDEVGVGFPPAQVEMRWMERW